MSQEIQQRLRPLSHNVYSYNQDTRSSTANPQKSKQGTIYKGNFLSKALSPLNQEALAFQQRIRPITTGGIQYPQTAMNKSNHYLSSNQQLINAIEKSSYKNSKPRTATYTSKQKTSQSTQAGRPSTTQERNLLDFNLVESEVYPGIYYAKKNILSSIKFQIIDLFFQQKYSFLKKLAQRKIQKYAYLQNVNIVFNYPVKFPNQIKSLRPEDYRLNLIYQIIQKLFHEITFYLFNILICQHQVTQNYVVFFSDAESVPFSKCCNSPVYIELYETGTGRIMCNEKTCQMQLLTEFIINFEEGQNLWKENMVFTQNANQDTNVRRQVSKLITTGFFKHKSIVREVKKMQKFITSKPKQLNDFYPLSTNSQDQFQHTQGQFYSNPFLTAQEEGFQAYYNQKPYGFNQMNAPPEFQDLQFQVSDQNYMNQQTQSKGSILPKNIQLINKEDNLPFNRLKIDQGELISLNQKIASGLVQNSQVFNKEFKNNKIGINQTLNKWRPQSIGNVDGSDYQFRNTLTTNIPNIRLKSGFNKEKRNKSSNPRQQIEFINMQENLKQYEEEKTLLDIKNMINDILS